MNSNGNERIYFWIRGVHDVAKSIVELFFKNKSSGGGQSEGFAYLSYASQPRGNIGSIVYAKTKLLALIFIRLSSVHLEIWFRLSCVWNASGGRNS